MGDNDIDAQWAKLAAICGSGTSSQFPVTYQFPDGGQLRITDAAVVPIGDAFTYRELTYTRTGDHERPSCEVVLQVRDGVPICSSFRIWSDDGDAPVRLKDLKQNSLEHIRDNAYGIVGLFRPDPNGKGMVAHLGGAAFLRDRHTVERAAGQRRRMTDALLNRVAEIHDSVPPGQRIEAIRTAFGVQDRQAKRYIAAAKEKGLIK